MTTSIHPPVFVIGVHRSGTSLLNMMLDGNSELWIPYESHFIVKLHKKYAEGDHFEARSFREWIVKDILEDEYVKGWEVDIGIEDIDLDDCRDLASTIDTVYSAHASKAGKTRWGDKTPSYVMHADRLNELFPQCRFVHLVRDGRDVARSVVQRTWGVNDYISALRGWARKTELAEKMLRMLPPQRRMTLRFEDLVAAPEDNLRNICTFLDLEFEESMLSYQERARAKVGNRIRAHHSHLSEKPRTDLTMRWKREMSPIDQAIAQEVAGEMLSFFGYDSGTVNHPLKSIGKLRHRISETFSWRLAGRSQ